MADAFAGPAQERPARMSHPFREDVAHVHDA
jgi:hypothetical protein